MLSESIEVLRHAYLCLLSSALQAYFQTCDVFHGLGPRLQGKLRREIFTKG